MKILSIQNLPFKSLTINEPKSIFSTLYEPKFDIFELGESESDYAKFLRLTKNKPIKTEKRYKELISRKDLVVSPLEAYIFSNRHTLQNIFDFCEQDQLYDYDDFEEEHTKLAEEYALICNNKGYELTQQDIQNCMTFGENPTTGYINLACGLKYVGLLNGYSPLKMPLNKSEAKWFIGEDSTIKEINSYLKFVKKNPKLKEILDVEAALNADFEIHRIQETKDYQIVSTRTFIDAKGNEKKNFKIIQKNGIAENSTSKTKDGYTISNKDSSPIINMVDENTSFFDAENIENSYDIILGKDKKPISVIQTKLSSDLNFAYLTRGFNIVEEKETIEPQEITDICKKVPDNNFSNIRKNNDGSIDFEQFYNYDKTKFQSYYYQNKDNSENIYTINIQNEGREILDFNRAFEKIDENTTLTEVNGKKYLTRFNEKHVTILTNDKTIDFDIENYFSGSENIEDNMEFIKSIPADILIAITKAKYRILIDKEMSGGFFDTIEIDTPENLSFLAHELGHAIDFKLNKCENKSSFISQNNQLKKVYEEELNNYQKLFPYRVQSMAINYFSKTGIDDFERNKVINTGLSEIVAETYALLVTYATKDDATQFRSNTLVKYFPKTIALSAKLLNEKIS